ncbi:MAG: hypothetical protein AAF485_09110 [Chloroflexota bacterium]
MLKQRMINAVVALALAVGVIGGINLFIDVEAVGQLVTTQAIAGHNGSAGGGG